MTTICVAVGPFGRAVADELDDVGEVSDIYAPDTLPADPASVLPLAEQYIVAAWRPDPGRMLALASTVAQRGATLLPITYDHPEIVVGPIVAPAGGPCPQCFRTRRMQHRHAVSLIGPARGVSGGIDADTAGFLPPSATIAAHAAAALLAVPAFGEYIALGPITMSVRRGRAVGMTDCPSCGRRTTAIDHTMVPTGARR